MVCFRVSHFCEFGIRHNNLCETKANSFTFTSFVQHRSDGWCNVRCLVFATSCTKCQQDAKEREEQCHLEGWKLVEDGGTQIIAGDNSKVRITSSTETKAELFFAVRDQPRFMTLKKVQAGSEVELQTFRFVESSKQCEEHPNQSETLLSIPASDPMNGLLAHGSGAALRYSGDIA
eukprot:6469811-Amphidinium_carterae.1